MYSSSAGHFSGEILNKSNYQFLHVNLYAKQKLQQVSIHHTVSAEHFILWPKKNTSKSSRNEVHGIWDHKPLDQVQQILVGSGIRSYHV